MSNVIGLSDEHEANLRKLAAYLRQPELRAAFHMALFCEHGLGGLGAEDCGSVGCAIGHGPYAGIPKRLDEDWDEYSERVFGISFPSMEWGWCFVSSWVYVDNTPDGAADRIEWMLERGIPADWIEQMNGDAPLCYRTGDAHA